MPTLDPIRETDDDARALAQSLLTSARIAGLGVIDPDTGGPMVTRVAVSLDRKRNPVSLVSQLSHHTRALQSDPRASLLLGEPAAKGDPLTHPRLTLMGQTAFVDRKSENHTDLRRTWLVDHPKSKLYVDFADFAFVRFRVTKAYLNGGFGAAFVLTAEDLGMQGD